MIYKLKKITASLLFVALIFSCNKYTPVSKQPNTPIKIACVGNSITYGYGIDNPKKNSFPAQLQTLLGEDFIVKNFGVSGRTLIKKGDYPYWETDAYKNALQFKADIVYIKLGSNDCKQQNRIYLDEFEENYNELIDHFIEQNHKVRIVLLLPIPSFVKDSTSIWNPVIKKQIIPKVQNIAYQNNLEILDLYQLFINQPDLLPDQIHPTVVGARIIANRLFDNVHFNTTISTVIADKSIEIGKKSNFYGYESIQFKFLNLNCNLAKPKKIASGKPWVLRAQYWGLQPQTDIALLERGFHIAYCDVRQFYGSKEAVKNWDAFYKLMIKNGFSEKVILEATNMGGLLAYNWSAKNATKISCIYANSPLLDIKSWLNNLGGNNNSEDKTLFRKYHKLNSEESVTLFSDDPIHKIKTIAQGGYPIVHVLAVTDTLASNKKNTQIFEKKIRKAGGNITVIYKNGENSNHNLKNATPMVNFILKNRKHN